jgi:PEGA domain-containing protein
MNGTKSIPVLSALALALALPAADAAAQVRGGGRGPIVGHAMARVPGPRGFPGRVFPGRSFAGRPIFISPRVVRVFPYRPYFYPFRPGLTIGFYSGYGYPYSYYGYPYPAYGYPYGGYPYAAYPYAASPYGYGGYPPASYVSMRPGGAYGGVQIHGAPRDAQVFADGYYVGIVDDFDGPFQHLNLEAGVHQIEIRVPGQAPIAFEVNVQPGQTITYHAGLTQ